MVDVPRYPRLLGFAGLLPQFACLVLAYFGSGEWQDAGRVVGAIYAALIFTFLGGTWWGIAAGAPAAERRGGLAWLWIAAVVPSLISAVALGLWLSGRLPIEPVLVTLGGGLMVALGVDSRVGSLAPRWWLSLRVPLSVVLGVTTIAIALA